MNRAVFSGPGGLAILLAAGIQSAAAQEVFELDPVIVEATRLAQPLAGTGTSITVITDKDLERNGSPFVLDALTATPGVTVSQSGPFGGIASLRIRGAATQHTLVLVDGLPVNSPANLSGEYNFAYLDPTGIERIEILKGPQSTLWGSDAIGGVVAISTKKAAEGFQSGGHAEYGSFNTRRFGAEAGYGDASGHLYLSGSTLDSDGISKVEPGTGPDEKDSYSANTLVARGGLNLPDRIRLDASLRWNTAKSEYDGFNLQTFQLDPATPSVAESREWSGNAMLQFPLADGRLENQLLLGHTASRSEDRVPTATTAPNGSVTYLPDDQPDIYDGRRNIYRYQGTLEAGRQAQITFGAEHETTRLDNEGYARASHRARINGLFTLVEAKPLDRLTLTGGLRRDNHSRAGGETTGRAAAAWDTGGVTLRASWAQGFNAPTTLQILGLPVQGILANPDLQPEFARSVEFGARVELPDGRGELDWAVFRQRTRDQIGFDTLLDGEGNFAGFRYANIARAEQSGIEVSGRLPVGDRLEARFALAALEAEDQDGTPLLRVPSLTADLALALDPTGPFSAVLLARHNGSEPEFGGGTIPAWTRFDATGRYHLSEQVEIYARIENLTDKHYQQILGYSTPGRSAALGVRARF